MASAIERVAVAKSSCSEPVMHAQQPVHRITPGSVAREDRTRALPRIACSRVGSSSPMLKQPPSNALGRPQRQRANRAARDRQMQLEASSLRSRSADDDPELLDRVGHRGRRLAARCPQPVERWPDVGCSGGDRGPAPRDVRSRDLLRQSRRPRRRSAGRDAAPHRLAPPLSLSCSEANSRIVSSIQKRPSSRRRSEALVDERLRARRGRRSQTSSAASSVQAACEDGQPGEQLLLVGSAGRGSTRSSRAACADARARPRAAGEQRQPLLEPFEQIAASRAP